MYWINEQNVRKSARIALVVFTILSVFIGLGLRNLTFDYDFEKFFPDDDPETKFYKTHRARFESDNDFLLIAIENKAGVFQSDFLKKIDRLTKQIEKQVPDVQRVVSITSAKQRQLLPLGAVVETPYIQLDNPNLQRDSARIFQAPELLNSLIARDAQSVCVYVRHTDYIAKKASDRMLDKIDALIATHQFDDVHIAGRTIGQKRYVEIMVDQMVLFLGLSAGLIMIFLLLTFRSFWGLIIPSVVIGLSTAWLLGLMGWFGVPINILLITLPTILFIVGMSDVIHLVSHYVDAVRAGDSKIHALQTTVREVGYSAFLTSISTSIGFGTLYFVDMEPIQVFGVVTAVGVLIAFALTILLLPVMLLVFPTPKYVERTKEGSLWQPYLRTWFIGVLRQRKWILSSLGLLVLIGLYGLTMLRSNNYLMDDLRADEPLKQHFNYLDKHYGGIRPFELAVAIADENLSMWDPEVIHELDAVENYLKRTYGAAIKLSLPGSVKLVHRAMHFNEPNFYSLPDQNSDWKKCRRILKRIEGGKFIRTIIDSAESHTRLHGNFPDIGSIEIAKRNASLEKYLAKHDLNGRLHYRITGTAHVFDRHVQYLSGNLMDGLGIEILLLSLLMAFVYRSWRMILIFLIPNIIPLLLVGALMGYLSIELKTSTAIIFTIALGISVDDTIHLLGKYKHELAQGKSRLIALKTAYLTTVKATILTTFILCAGFFLLVFSAFLGAHNMGLLISITLFVALLIEMTLLPILIVLFYRKKPTK
ncbi:MAG: efflux RND transporter permease subunit [Fluviicola sp.]